MPELPEVETVRRTLKNFILNKKITKVTVIYDKIITGDPAVFVASVTGQTIRDIDRRGKYLIFILDETAFVSHLRMEGKYNIVAPEREINKHEHIIFHLDGNQELRYQDVRKFGRLELVSKDNYRQTSPLDKLGPEPWDADPEVLYQKFKKSGLPIKALLLDQSILAGIGNIYANEICYRLKIRPQTPGSQMTPARAGELIAVAGEILKQAIEQGGTTVHSFASGGVTGRFQNELQIHMRKSCPVCGTPVTKIALGGRGTYYCENCQG